MESHIIVAIIALALIMVSGTPVPLDSNRKQGSIVAVKVEEPTPLAVTPVQHAQERQSHGQTDPITQLSNTLMAIPPMYTSPSFGGKRPFEEISGPYQSNSVFGQPFQGGPFGGLGVPLSNGPLGGIMSVPLLYLMG